MTLDESIQGMRLHVMAASAKLSSGGRSTAVRPGETARSRRALDRAGGDVHREGEERGVEKERHDPLKLLEPHVAGSNRGPATTCRRTGPSSSGSRSEFESVFQSRPRFHQMSQQLYAHRHLENDTPLKHAPLKFPEHGGRLRLIATLHDRAVIRRILAHVGVGASGPSPGPAPRSPALPRPDPICSGARRTPHEAPSMLLRLVRGPVDGGGVSRIACRSPASARSTREQAANVCCAVGSWGGQRPGLAPYVTGTGPRTGPCRRRAFMLPILRAATLWRRRCGLGPTSERPRSSSPALLTRC